MNLTIIDKMNEALDSFTENPLASLMPFFTGIICGFLLCLVIYLVIVVKSLKKAEKKASNVVLDIDNNVIKEQVESAKNLYIEESSFKTTSQKIVCLRDVCWELMNDIAKTFYPESKYPLYELSIEEIILLSNYILDRIEGLFDGVIAKKLKTIKISYVLKIIDMKKKYDQNKLIKAANKYQVSKGVKITMNILNVFNPAYWVKKIMIDGTVNIGIKKIALTIIDVVGEETANVYSKNIFVKKDDKEILEELNKLEGIIEGESNET